MDMCGRRFKDQVSNLFFSCINMQDGEARSQSYCIWLPNVLRFRRAIVFSGRGMGGTTLPKSPSFSFYRNTKWLAVASHFGLDNQHWQTHWSAYVCPDSPRHKYIYDQKPTPMDMASMAKQNIKCYDYAASTCGVCKSTAFLAWTDPLTFLLCFHVTRGGGGLSSLNYRQADTQGTTSFNGWGRISLTVDVAGLRDHVQFTHNIYLVLRLTKACFSFFSGHCFCIMDKKLRQVVVKVPVSTWFRADYSSSIKNCLSSPTWYSYIHDWFDMARTTTQR